MLAKVSFRFIITKFQLVFVFKIRGGYTRFNFSGLGRILGVERQESFNLMYLALMRGLKSLAGLWV